MSIMSENGSFIARETKMSIDEIYDCYRAIHNKKGLVHWTQAHAEELKSEIEVLYRLFLIKEEEGQYCMMNIQALQEENEALKESMRIDGVRIESDHE